MDFSSSNALNKNKRSIGFLMTISIIYIFFSYIKYISGLFNTNTVFLGLLWLSSFTIYFKKTINIKFIHIDIMWFFLTLYFLFNTLILPNDEGKIYFFFFSTMVFLLVFLRSNTEWVIYFRKLLWVSSGLHTFFVISQFLFPSLVTRLNSVLLSDSAFEITTRSLMQNYNTGITNQASSAGMFTTIFCALAFNKLITEENKKKKNFFILLLGFIALLLTQKRSFLIASILSILFILFIYNDKKIGIRIKRFLSVGLLMIIVGTIVLLVFPETQNVLLRFFEDRSLFSSRESMYRIMLNWYEQNKLFGMGLGTAQTKFGFGGHNIYLQVLGETGIVGFVLFYSALFGTIIFNIKQSTKYIKINKKERKIHALLLLSLYMQVIFIFYGISGNPIYDYTYFLLLIFFLATPQSVLREQKYKQLIKLEVTS